MPYTLHQSHPHILVTGLSMLQEEKQEKAFRLAEMEATKAGNIIEHEAEIYSRPKREWFLTNKKKKDSAQAAAQHEQGTGQPARDSKKKKESHKGPKAVRGGMEDGIDHDHC
jgi:ATP-dependent RNA helicase DDX27